MCEVSKGGGGSPDYVHMMFLVDKIDCDTPLFRVWYHAFQSNFNVKQKIFVVSSTRAIVCVIEKLSHKNCSLALFD